MRRTTFTKDENNNCFFNCIKQSYDNFANIGKSVIIESLGIQKNYTEVIEATVETIDYNNAACINCKYKAVIETFGKDSRAYSDACSTWTAL